MLIMIYCVKKLHFYGLRGFAHEWIQSYLENRKQFIMYINDICKVSQVFKYILFANDTNYYVVFETCSNDKWWFRTTANMVFC